MRICLACGSSIAVDKGPCPVCASPGSPPSESLPRVGSPSRPPAPGPMPTPAPGPMPTPAPAPMPGAPQQGYRPPPGPVTEAVASVSRPRPGGGLLPTSRQLLVVLAVPALVLVGAIVKIGWFSSSGTSTSTSAAGPSAAVAGSGATGSGATGSAPPGSQSGTPTAGGVGTGGVDAAVATLGLVQADDAVRTATAPMVSVALVRTLATYAGGINAKDLTTAYAVYSARQQALSPFPTWSRGVQDSRLSGVHIVSAVGAIDSLGSGPVTVDVTFTSHQPGSRGPVSGQTCTEWALQYTLVPDAAGNGYLIDSARPSAGSSHTACPA